MQNRWEQFNRFDEPINQIDERNNWFNARINSICNRTEELITSNEFKNIFTQWKMFSIIRVSFNLVLHRNCKINEQRHQVKMYLVVYVPLKNILLTNEGLQNLGLCSALRAFSREGSLSCQTCCDTGPWFFRSHPKDRPISSPFTTHEGMWRIYSNPDPHGAMSSIILISVNLVLHRNC
jgi:hypothetical protein